MRTSTEPTIEDLYSVPDNQKAEIADGELVLMSPTGGQPSRASSKIWLSLYEYEQRTGSGIAVGDNTGFVVNLPNRKSFSPDAAYHVGESPGMKFYNGAPIFAAEVRSENDYGDAAEQAIAAKRDDYFAAGTEVVWDVDLLHDNVIRVYEASDPKKPRIYRRGDIAEAEPALKGWSMPVDELFE